MRSPISKKELEALNRQKETIRIFEALIVAELLKNKAKAKKLSAQMARMINAYDLESTKFLKMGAKLTKKIRKKVK
jgi:hypothetical protein